MLMTYSATRGRYEIATDPKEKHEPISAGCHWDRDVCRWHTRDVEIASGFRGIAGDDETLARLDADLVLRRDASARNLVDSCATRSDIRVPAPAGLVYLPHQLAGIAFAMGRADTLMSDEPGLGRTTQALGIVNAMSHDIQRPSHILIVSTKTSLSKWAQEAHKWLVAPHTVEIWSTKDQRNADVVIVNYDIVARHDLQQALRARKWDLVVYDAAHALRDPNAARTQALLGSWKAAIRPLPAKMRLFVCRAPVFDKPIDLYPMLNAMGLAAARNRAVFTERFCTGFHHGGSGASNTDELQHLLRSSVMVRRTKNDVIADGGDVHAGVDPCTSVIVGDRTVHEAAAPSQGVRRPIGRPRLHAEPLTGSERTRRWRDRHEVAGVVAPARIVARLHELRATRGESVANFLSSALDALGNPVTTDRRGTMLLSEAVELGVIADLTPLCLRRYGYKGDMEDRSSIAAYLRENPIININYPVPVRP